jgi:hypothetical protein
MLEIIQQFAIHDQNLNNDRNIDWQNASSLWEDTDSYWNTI